jgi:dTMP kinase
VAKQDKQSNSVAPAPGTLHPERPCLIVLEGIDLSGRTTQVQLLHDWLVAQHYPVTRTAWRSSPLISDLLTRARTGPPLRPLTYSLLFAADHMDRTQHVIKPALERGEVVLADRYTFTAFARDAARGIDAQWVRNVYHFALQPDIVFYLHISPEEAVKRRLALQQQRELVLHGKKGGHNGQDNNTSKHKKKDKYNQKQEKKHLVSPPPVQPPTLTPEALESFRNFEVRMYSEYQEMQKEFGFTVVEGSQPIEQVQTILRRATMRLLLEQ